MDGETASWIFYSGLLIYGLVLFAFKRLYLDTLESRVLSYMLGLVLAYGILAGVLFASREYETVRYVLQHATWGLRFNHKGAGAFLLGVPACYSAFLLGYPKKGGKSRSWKNKIAITASVFVNMAGSLLVAIYIAYYSDVGGVKAFFEDIAAGFDYIEWEYVGFMAGVVCLLIAIIKYHHSKYYKK